MAHISFLHVHSGKLKDWKNSKQDDVMFCILTLSTTIWYRSCRCLWLSLSPTTACWQLVYLDEFPTLAETKRSVSGSNPRQHKEGQPVDHPSSTRIGRQLRPQHHQALQGIAKAQGLGDATSELSVIDRTDFEKHPSHGNAKTAIQPQNLVGMMTVSGGGCDGKEETVRGQNEEKAGGDGQSGIEIEQIVESASSVAFGRWRRHYSVRGMAGMVS